MSATLSSQDTISGLLDITTPLNSAFKGIYMRSYAFVTMKDRLPGILTKVTDILSRDKEEIGSKYGKESLEELKDVIERINELKNEIVTNKPLKPLTPVPDDGNDDSKIWNNYLEETTKREGQVPNWFQATWLYSEGYMYRRLAQEFALT
ncbi:protein-glutamate O-methyltransferase [Orussus abietinus]|uniref:protein-glutamate O-methyltransferase n=1 Tax=Orussus abietinus TaxID=222816 RepID=UPI000C715DFA|nr:protein-glutamate O-methyltransferase [Orussus abietinus]